MPTALEDIQSRLKARQQPASATAGGSTALSDIQNRIAKREAGIAPVVPQVQSPATVDPTDVSVDTPYTRAAPGDTESMHKNIRIMRRRISNGRPWMQGDDETFASMPPDIQKSLANRMSRSRLVQSNYNPDDAQQFSGIPTDSLMAKRVEMEKLESGGSLVLRTIQRAARKTGLEGGRTDKAFKEALAGIDPETHGPVLFENKVYSDYFDRAVKHHRKQKWLYDYAKGIVSDTAFLDPKDPFKGDLTPEEKNTLIGFVQELSPTPEERGVFGKTVESVARGTEELAFTIPDHMRMLSGSEEERQLAHDAFRLRQAYYSGDIITGDNMFSQGLFDVARMGPAVGASMAAGGPIRATLAVWWPVGTMELYHDIRDAGASDSIARPWSIGLGLAYGAVETLQLQQMGLGHAKKQIQRDAFHSIWQFMWAKVKASPGVWTKEMAEELVQGGIKIGNEAIVRSLDEQLPNMDKTIFNKRMAGLEEELRRAAIPLAYMMIGGAGVQTGRAALQQRAEQVEAAKPPEAPVSPAPAEATVTPSEVVTPETAPVAPVEAPPEAVTEPVEEISKAPVDKSGSALSDLSGKPATVNTDGTITLFHRTSPEASKEILSTGKFISAENTQEVFLSTKRDGQAEGFGSEVIEVRVSPDKVRIDDAFDDEIHVAAHISDIIPVAEAAPVAPAGPIGEVGGEEVVSKKEIAEKPKKPKPLGKPKKKGLGVKKKGRKVAEPSESQVAVNEKLRERNKKTPDHIASTLVEGASVRKVGDSIAKRMHESDANALIAKNLKKLLDTTPEFAIDPTFTVDADGWLVFRDGYKMTFAPDTFGIDTEGMKAGTTVRMDLDALGIASARYVKKAETIAKKGFPQRKPAKVGLRGHAPTMRVTQDSKPEAEDRVRFGKRSKESLGEEMLDLGIYPEGGSLAKASKAEVVQLLVDEYAKRRFEARGREIATLEAAEKGKPAPKVAEKKTEKEGKTQAMAAQTGDPFSGPLRMEGPVSKVDVGVKTIRDSLGKLFGVKIAKGRMGSSHAGGFYKTREQVVRTKHYGVIGIDVHEVGHHLDKTTDVLKGISNEMRTELKDLDYNPEKRRTKEGFSEFFRHFLVDGDSQAVAPKFYGYFVNTFLPGASQDVQNAIKENRRLIIQWQEQGAEARFDAQIDYGVNRWRRFNPLSIGKGAWDWFIREFVQKYDPIRQAELEITGGQILPPSQSPFALAKRVGGIAAAQVREAAMNGTFDLETGETIGPSLRDILEPLRGNRKEFGEAMRYALAQHAVDVWKMGKDPGFLRADAQFVLDKYADRADYKAVAEGLTGWHQWLMGQLVKQGGFPVSVADHMRQMYPHFVSLMRAEYLKGGTGGGGKKFANLISPVRRLGGKGGGPVLDPVSTALIYAERFLSVANKVRVGKALIGISRKYGGKGHVIEAVPGKLQASRVSADDVIGQLRDMGVEVDTSDSPEVNDAMLTFFSQMAQPDAKDNVIVLWEDGKKKTFQVTERLHKSLAGMDPFQLGPILNWVLGGPARLRRLGATGLNPGFSLFANPWRDWFVSTVQTEAQVPLMPVIAVRSIYHALADLFGNSKAATLFRRGGGEMAQPLGLDRKMLKEAASKARAHGWGQKTTQAMMSPLASLRNLFSVTEAGTRLAEFTSIAKKNGWTRLDEGMEPDVMLKASEGGAVISVDFLQSGRTGRVLNSIISFFNAPIQAVAIMGRNFKNHPVRTTIRGLVNITLPTLLLWWHNKDEEWYKDLPAWRKYNFWNFRAFGYTWSMPRPFEYGALFASIPEAFANQMYNEDPEAVKEALGESFKGLMPPLIPTAIEGVIEIDRNKSFFTDRPIVSRRLEGLPPEEQYLPWTSETSKLIGDAVGMSPVALDHLLRSYTGGLGLDVAKAVEAGGRALKGGKPKPSRPSEPSDWPVVGRLLMREGTTRVFDDFYNELQALEQEYQASRKRGKPMTSNRKARRKKLGRVARKLSKIRVNLRELDAKEMDIAKKRQARLVLVKDMIRRVKQTQGAK